jgi:arginyl-tRNA synthetase
MAALKYSILKQAVGSDIVFDFEKSISFEGDSGPYLQYALVRARSVLEKAKSEKIKPSFKLVPPEVSGLEPKICYFPEIVEWAARDYAPNYLVLYLTELARVYNNYYAKVKIVDSEDKYSPYKVVLTSAFEQVMKNGLEILGISAPKKM